MATNPQQPNALELPHRLVVEKLPKYVQKELEDLP